MSSVHYLPPGYNTVTPSLVVDGADKAIDFYKRAFNAEADEIHRSDAPANKIMHARLRLGDSNIFINDYFPEWPSKVTQSDFYIYVPDVDAAFKRAVDAGAKAESQPADMFWGDRTARLSDAFGQKWTLAARKKEMTSAEMETAGQEFRKSMKAKQGDAK